MAAAPPGFKIKINAYNNYTFNSIVDELQSIIHGIIFPVSTHENMTPKMKQIKLKITLLESYLKISDNTFIYDGVVGKDRGLGDAQACNSCGIFCLYMLQVTDI